MGVQAELGVGQGCKCKGPVVGGNLACWRNRQAVKCLARGLVGRSELLIASSDAILLPPPPPPPPLRQMGCRRGASGLCWVASG